MTAPTLSLQDRIALIYSGAGSQREVARRLGISHQKVGRILKAGFPELGGYKSVDSPAMRDPELRKLVNKGFAKHRAFVEKQAKADGIPYSREIPIYTRRMVTSTGEPSDRVRAPFLHWVSDRVRDMYMRRMVQTKKFVAFTIGSVVNLQSYLRRRRDAPVNRNDRLKRQAQRDSIKAIAARGVDVSVMYSPKIDMTFRGEDLSSVIRTALRRHESSIGPDKPGTVRGSVVLMELAPREKSTKKSQGKTSAKSGEKAGVRKRAGSRSK